VFHCSVPNRCSTKRSHLSRITRSSRSRSTATPTARCATSASSSGPRRSVTSTNVPPRWPSLSPYKSPSEDDEAAPAPASTDQKPRTGAAEEPPKAAPGGENRPHRRGEKGSRSEGESNTDREKPVVVSLPAAKAETTTTTVSKKASQGKVGNLGSLMGRPLPARTLREGLGRLRDDGRERQRRAPIEPHPSVRKCFRHSVALVLQWWGTRSQPVSHLAPGPPARSLRRLLVAHFARRLFTAASLHIPSIAACRSSRSPDLKRSREEIDAFAIFDMLGTENRKNRAHEIV
jgi:hypothetical protein